MRSFSLFAAFALATSALATRYNAVRDDSGCLAEICAGPVDLSQSIPTTTVVDGAEGILPSKRMTNAERFARGMVPAAPRRRVQRGSPVVRDVPSSVPSITKRGVIQVTGNTGAILGYISDTSFSKAQYRYTPDLVEAMIVNFQVPLGALSASGFNFNVENSDITTPTLLGFVEGRDNPDANIAPGTFNYGYFAATAQTAPGAPPSDINTNSYTTVTNLVRSVESAVWSIDLVSGAITAQWINIDSSAPATQLFTQGTALYFGGDSAAFAARYPSPVTIIALTFIGL